jgi:hypothetical protein
LILLRWAKKNQGKLVFRPEDWKNARAKYFVRGRVFSMLK